MSKGKKKPKSRKLNVAKGTQKAIAEFFLNTSVPRILKRLKEGK